MEFFVQFGCCFAGMQASFESGGFRGLAGAAKIGEALLEALLGALIFVLGVKVTLRNTALGRGFIESGPVIVIQSRDPISDRRGVAGSVAGRPDICAGRQSHAEEYRAWAGVHRERPGDSYPEPRPNLPFFRVRERGPSALAVPLARWKALLCIQQWQNRGRWNPPAPGRGDRD